MRNRLVAAQPVCSSPQRAEIPACRANTARSACEIKE
jgi:hypothetical protein